MKKWITTAACITSIMTISKAQTTVTGMIGLHSSTTSANVALSESTGGLVNLKPIATFTGGVVVDQALDNRLSFSTGVHFRSKGFKILAGSSVGVLGLDLGVGVKATTQISYVEVPFMLKANLSNSERVQPYLGVGPSISYAASGTLRTSATAIFDFNVSNTDIDLTSDNYNRWQLGGQAVAGALIPYGQGHWMAEVGYSRSFTNLVSDDFLIDAGGRHSGLTFSVGYGMRF